MVQGTAKAILKNEFSFIWIAQDVVMRSALARFADKRAHISKKTWPPIWKGDISACTERQSRCSWLSTIHDFYCVMFENEHFVFEPKQTETHSRPI